METSTLTARIDFPADCPDAVLTINEHRYWITWDDEHTNPCAAAERLMARYEHAARISPWSPNPSRSKTPTGWTTTAQLVDTPALEHV